MLLVSLVTYRIRTENVIDSLTGHRLIFNIMTSSPIYYVPVLCRGPHSTHNAATIAAIDSQRKKYSTRVAVCSNIETIRDYLQCNCTEFVDYEWQKFPDFHTTKYIWFLNRADVTAFILKFGGKIV